ncbi:sulfur carrier protein [Frankia sp. AiPs1]|uniref:sulfur carrier protein ThiS n=1 Tax=Frankia sp. AiPa1 TaxID=573492 RepID=UPI00202B9EDF|nr:sulfur carrier protein ThiS [Frankia sp. AiPa1]MCL9762334.1 sulfur carrier protein ThiS [Frankia sp. AiPa1]
MAVRGSHSPSVPTGGPASGVVVVNGVRRAVRAGQALSELLIELGLRPGSVVVERNGAALTPTEAATTRLADGDVLEIVRAVAGG